MEGGEITDLQSALIEYEGDSSDEFDGGTSGEGCWRTEVIEEGKKQLWLAGPLVAVSLLQQCLVLISIMFVGHLGELPLSGASMAISFASVTGFDLLVSGFILLIPKTEKKKKKKSQILLVFQNMG